MSCGSNFLICLSDVLSNVDTKAEVKLDAREPKGILKKRNTEENVLNIHTEDDLVMALVTP